MWQSEDDVLRDIASLNDFGPPEDKESYKILYSVGRGFKTKEKPKNVEKFLDSRTGEAINLENDSSNACYKSKGRGSVLGSSFRTRLQLQQQLRLARPLGSGDEAIESYYGKSRSTENVEYSTKTSDPEPIPQHSRATSESHNAELSSDKIKKRVKATRNSTSQVNALITNLLSKNQVEADVLKSDAEIEQLQSSPNNSDKCDMYDKIDNMQKSSLNNLNFSNLSLSSKWKKNLDNFKESTSTVENENFKIIDDDDDDDEEEMEEKAKKKETKNYDENLDKIKENFKLNINGFNSTESENNHDLKYRALGEKLNRLQEIRSNTTGNKSYDVAPLSEYCVPTESAIFVDEDFPPLRKS